MTDVTNGPALPSSREDQLVADTLRTFSELTSARSTFAAHWSEVAELVMPTHRNTFYYGNYNVPGEKKTYRQVDATAMLANTRFAAIVDSLLTPRNMTWHQLEADDAELKKSRRVRLWFEDTTRKLFKLRYTPEANFSSQNNQNFQSIGAFGNAGLFIDKHASMRGFRYRSTPLGELFFKENHQGQVCEIIRWYRLSASQAKAQFGDKMPVQLQSALTAKSESPFDFLHHIFPNPDHDPDRFLDNKAKLYRSLNISIQGRCLLQEGGYNSFPLPVARYEQAPGEVYGRGPAMMVLPAIKTLNAEKTTFLKQGHRAADPILLTTDDGIVGMSMRPGAMNKGGMSYDGKPLVGVLPTGAIQISEEMMQKEADLINDAFLVRLFQILTESPQMTATEVIERTTEKGILLAPTIGGMQSGYLGGIIDRELDLASELGLLEPMPPELMEAKGQYHVVYTSPLSKAQRAQEAAGFMRTLETAMSIVQVTADPAPLDRFDFDSALAGLAEINGMPESWMSDDNAIKVKRDNRAKAQQQQVQIQAAPAAAAIMKAKAVQQKNGAKA